MLPGKILGFFHMYGLMIAVGILACFGVLFQFGKKRKIESRFIDFVFYNAIAAIMVGFGSAALFQATYNYIENPSAGFNFNGGITFIGGLIGGVVAFLVGYAIFRKKYEARLVDIMPIVPCCITIAHAFGRVGCFFAGCCYGKQTDSFLGVHFPNVPGKVHPTQLYEAIFLLAVFAICYLLYWKKHFKHTMSLYLICYGVFRFSIEYLRGDHRGELLGFISPSQFWSILMVVIGVGLYFLLNWLFQKRFMEHASTLPSGGNAEENTVQTIEESSTEGAESVEETPAKTESESMEAEE
jgi:phosphatidylglycerol:prolipoprotein diacylglycerol transferase